MQKKALTYALTALAVLAIAMVAYYSWQRRMAGSSEISEVTEEAPVENGAEADTRSEFVGTYSSDGSLVAGDQRIAFFTVNQASDGGYLGSAKVEAVGGSQSFFFECNQVRIGATEFFLNCLHSSQGRITLSGTWAKPGDSVEVEGKVLWLRDGTLLLEAQRHFSISP